jgi:hypothetical protein
MRGFDINWTDFIRWLSVWNQLSPSARTAFVDLQHNDVVKTWVFQGRDGLMVQYGVMEYCFGNERMRLTKQGAVFAAALRAMMRHDFLARHDNAALVEYLQAYFSTYHLVEVYQQIYLPKDDRYYQPRRITPSQMAAYVASTDWVSRFLAEVARRSEMSIPRRRSPSWLRNAERVAEPDDHLKIVQKLVRHLMELPEPLPMVELPARWNDLPLAPLGPVIAHGIADLVLFPFMRQPDLTPMLGLWPAIHRRLHRPKVGTPSAVEAGEALECAWVMEDMTTVLVTAAGRPLRLRQSDFGLFAKAESELQEAMLPMPDWAAKSLEYHPKFRLAVAIDWLQRLELAHRVGEHGKDLRLETTAKGEAWLSKTPKLRLQFLLDRIRNPSHDRARDSLYTGGSNSGTEVDELACGHYYDRSPISFLPASLHVPGRPQKDVDADLRQSVREAFGAFAPGRFVRLDEFLAWQAEEVNPLPNIVRGKGAKVTRNADDALASLPSEALEEGWARFLKQMLQRRLVLLGGAQWGLDQSGKHVCFAITDAGRYLLGLAEDFEYGRDAEASAQVVVQPNFDVVFLTASPQAEMSIARFAQRKGRGVGTLFSITKKSIIAAAGSGMTAGQVLDTLQSFSAKPVPPNVAREISGWFDQCRRIQIRPAVLIQCPDADTALRVVAASRQRAKALNDTVVELTEPRSKAELVRKLHAAGIFVDRAAAKT